jgi:hypothetical protein
LRVLHALAAGRDELGRGGRELAGVEGRHDGEMTLDRVWLHTLGRVSQRRGLTGVV